MNINRENYEVFFLDYLEGRLDEASVAELRIFLDVNPDLAEELEGLDTDASFSFDHETFDAKDLLKKPESTLEIAEHDLWMAMELEGDISAEDLRSLDIWANASEDNRKQRELMKSTRLSADAVVFEFKEGLRFPNTIDQKDSAYRAVAALEGDLSKAEKDAFEKELSTNAILRKEWSALLKSKLQPEEATFEHKQSLQHPDSISLDDIQYLLVAKVEGDLTLAQNQKLSSLLAGNEMLQRELAALYNARLQPESIVFEGKQALKRKEAVVIPMRRILTAVTSVAAVGLVVFWFMGNNPEVPTQMAGTYTPEINGVQPHTSNSQENGGGAVDTKDDSTANSNPRPAVSPGITPKGSDLAQEKEGVPSENKAVKRLLPPSPMKLRGVEEEAFASHFDKGIILEAPDMSAIHQPDEQFANNLNTPKQTPVSQPATIWEMLGNAAEERLEKTAAYALVERQVERLTPDEEKVKYERVVGQAKDEVRLKLGKLEVKRGAKKRDGESWVTKVENWVTDRINE